MSKWYLHSGEMNDTVVSTRVRLARNICGYPFPARMSAGQRREVNKLIKDALLGSNSAVSGGFDYIEMRELSDLQALSLVERRLISPDFAKNREGRALLLQKDESISIMLGEEDHMRIQVMRPGMAVGEAGDWADKLDTLLDSNLKLAFHDQLGYLTQCPTNLGTGLRVSVMLHLPALEETGALSRLAAAVSKIGLTIRGAYGEGSGSEGSLYQLSNQVTLGISEEAAAENLEKVARQIIREELGAREQLRGVDLEDKIRRSVGILRNALKMDYAELTRLCSLARLGVAMGYLPDISLDAVGALTVETAPATLQLEAGRELEPAERDILRAERAREALKQA